MYNVCHISHACIIISFSYFSSIATVLVSDFNQLFDLKTLEIRGSKDMHFVVKFDEPIPWIQNLNLERVHLEAAETMKFRPNLEDIDPSQNFNYVPSSERNEYNISFVAITEEDIEIVPYEVYKQEKMTQEIQSKTISFFGWDNLKVLKIHECGMEDLYWEIFDGLSNLEHLSLEGNRIRELSPFTFYGTPNIKSLSLAHNEILDLNYRTLAGLLQLQLLDMSNNDIAKLSEQTFPPFPNLEIFDLRENPIKSIFPSTFGVMNKTQVLLLGTDNVAMEFNADQPFEFLSKLIYLEIQRLNAPKFDESTFKSLEKLEVIKIKSGKIPLIEFDTFTSMLNLRELHLTNCGIEEISMDTFFGAKKLEIVDLSNNQIRVIPPGIFDDQHEIVEIYLNNNHLTALPSDIFKLNSLKMIHLMENPWTCTCEMKNWRQAVVNKIRGGKLESVTKCDEMRQTKNSKCETSYESNYIFDHRMSPKCNLPVEVQDKSVFYALRRVFQCSPKPTTVPVKVEGIKKQKFTEQQKLEFVRKHMQERKKKERKTKQRQYQIQQRGRVESFRAKFNPALDHEDISNDL